MVIATGVFNDAEVEIAIELIKDRLSKGEQSEYSFLFIEQLGDLLGFTCYGFIPGTNRRYEVYWIVVSPAAQGKGVGKALMFETERIISEAGGIKVYAETSSRTEYYTTRHFYDSCGYTIAGTVKDHYDKNDDLVIFVKDMIEE